MIYEETNGIMEDVQAGLALLNSRADLLADIRANVKRIYKTIDRQSDHQRGGPRVRLVWN